MRRRAPSPTALRRAFAAQAPHGAGSRRAPPRAPSSDPQTLASIAKAGGGLEIACVCCGRTVTRAGAGLACMGPGLTLSKLATLARCRCGHKGARARLITPIEGLFSFDD